MSGLPNTASTWMAPSPQQQTTWAIIFGPEGQTAEEEVPKSRAEENVPPRMLSFLTKLRDATQTYEVLLKLA